MSAGKIVAIVVGIIVLILGGLFLLGVLMGVGVFATQNLTASAGPAACETERNTLVTAAAAAAATDDPTDTAVEYLAAELRFFQLDGNRIPATLSDVSAQDCPSLTGP